MKKSQSSRNKILITIPQLNRPGSGTDYHDFADTIASIIKGSALYHTMFQSNLFKANKLFTPDAVTQQLMK